MYNIFCLVCVKEHYIDITELTNSVFVPTVRIRNINLILHSLTAS